MEPRSSIVKHIRKSTVRMECPACGGESMESTMALLELPMLGEAVETTLVCQKCGFKTSDVMITGQSEAVRYSLKVEGADHLNARVVRSTSGTIRMPELGILIEPGPASEAFISNIEGVLVRVEGVLEGLEHENKAEVEKKIKEIEKARDALTGFTFIIEDPYGNSAILSDRAKKEILSVEEVKALRKGEIKTDAESPFSP